MEDAGGIVIGAGISGFKGWLAILSQGTVEVSKALVLVTEFETSLVLLSSSTGVPFELEGSEGNEVEGDNAKSVDEGASDSVCMPDVSVSPSLDVVIATSTCRSLAVDEEETGRVSVSVIVDALTSSSLTEGVTVKLSDMRLEVDEDEDVEVDEDKDDVAGRMESSLSNEDDDEPARIAAARLESDVGLVREEDGFKSVECAPVVGLEVVVLVGARVVTRGLPLALL